MIAPEVPTGGLVRQAVLDDQADGHRDDPMGVVAAGRGQVGQSALKYRRHREQWCWE